MFHKKGDIVIPKSAAKEDDLMSIVLDAGGEDLRDDGENWEVLTEPSAYEVGARSGEEGRHHTRFIERGHDSPELHQAGRGRTASTMIRLLEALEEHDDVQNVHSNFDIDQKLLEEVASEIESLNGTIGRRLRTGN